MPNRPINNCFCGGDAELIDCEGHYWCECFDCGKHRPSKDTEAEAIDDWNAHSHEDYIQEWFNHKLPDDGSDGGLIDG